MNDALALAAQVRAGDVSAHELVEAAIARAEATNPELNFLVTDCFEQARAGTPEDGPFAGVPMLVKDLTETAGVRTTFSSRAFEHYVPATDAAIVRRLKRAGFIVIGKSNTPEFGITAVTESELNGACRNPGTLPHARRLVGRCRRGGRRGRPAARARLGRRRLGAHPAACCGLFGIKPSRGRVSAAPNVSGSLELSQSGPTFRHRPGRRGVPGCDRRYEPGDAHWAPPPERPFLEEVGADPGRLRIAFTAEPAVPHPVDPRLVDVTRRAADALVALGHDVVERTPSWVDESVLSAFAKLWQLTPALYPVPDDSLLMPINRALAAAARETSSVEFAQAVGALLRAARRIVSFWDDIDVVLTPALAKLPVPVGWVFEPDEPWEQFARGGEFTPFTPIVNVTGQPAAVVPFEVVDGLPAGIQLIGPPAGEAVLFRLAAQLEAAHPWADRIRGLTHRG